MDGGRKKGGGAEKKPNDEDKGKRGKDRWSGTGGKYLTKLYWATWGREGMEKESSCKGKIRSSGSRE